MGRGGLAAASAALAAAMACGHAPAANAPVAGAPAAFVTPVDFTPVPETETLHATNPHDHGGKALCQRCHVQGERGLGTDPVALCTRCHDPKAMRHPWGVPQPNAPPDLKFGANGAIVCHTCHDPHDVKSRAAGLRFEYTALCKRCHVRHGATPRPR